MKKLLYIITLTASFAATAQSVGITTDGSTPDASAILEVKSTTQGFLPPRVALISSNDTTTPIASPATGLLVYNTATTGDVTPGFYYYSGLEWVRLASKVNVEVIKEFEATSAQTSFPLTQAPSENSVVRMYINGVMIKSSAYSVAGSTLTYDKTNNANYDLTAGDLIQFYYFY